jgi:hypothetical protein
MALTDTAIRNTKRSSDKAYKLPDEKGLLLFVTPAGGKLWRFNYRCSYRLNSSQFEEGVPV